MKTMIKDYAFFKEQVYEYIYLSARYQDVNKMLMM